MNYFGKHEKYLITCSDCGDFWTSYCPLCKSSNGKTVQVYGSVNKSKFKPENKNESINFLKDKFDKKYSPVIVKSKPKKIIPVQPIPITIENFFVSSKGIFKELCFIPDGFTRFFISKGSEYFSNKESDLLIRKSDHWGHNIRFCAWHLDGYKKDTSWKWKDANGKEKKIGIILFSELSINNAFKPNKNKIAEFESRHPI